ncbi:MAG: alpha-amylase family glycosyl hydrolase, partial [Mycetocola sp.]
MLRRLTAASMLVAISGLPLSACTATTAPTADVAFAAPDAGIQLFQLPWTSIAEECENTLGPNGFAWVLTSPPQEHVVRDEWWVSYQPVGYELESRLGTREEFADMVARCDDAGVAVIADAVINHMTGQDAAGAGWAGTPYEHYEYPGLYGVDDFHHCGLTGDDDIEDYDSREQVQTCELVNLADLDTASPRVRESIAVYLEDLLSLGVAGFRIDAAKHMAADDVAAIVASLPEGTRILSEVIRGGGEPIQPEEYTPFGEVFEFAYARDLGPQVQAGR